MKNKWKSLIGYVIIIAVGIGVYFYSEQYRHITQMRGDPSSAFMPQLCGVLMVLLSVIMLLRLFIKKKGKDDAQKADNSDSSAEIKDVEEKSKKESKFDLFRGIGSVLLLLFLVLTFDKLGFMISSAIYLFCQQLLFEKKGNIHWLRTVIVAIAVPVICYFFFVRFLNYMLPMGLLR